MTAIYGLWRYDEVAIEPDFKRMGAALQRYGLDRHETWEPDPDVRLARHLHVTLKEDQFRDRPISSSRYVVVGDVRLTERADLVRKLDLDSEADGLSDAAIASAALEKWHEEAFDRIYGAFAIAAWDKIEGRLLLARDHLGNKPLFFHRCPQFVAFASMPVGLLALPAVPRASNIDSMKRFLALQNPSPGKTHYQDIDRVDPGHFVIFAADGTNAHRYWRPDLTPLRLGSNEDYVRALDEQLNRALDASLRGTDGVVGAHLSCGFDSSAVATTAARRLASDRGKVVAFTAAPRADYHGALSGRTADESVLAAATAAMHSNMEHVIVRTDRTAMANLRRTASIYAAPVMNICNETWFDAINDAAADRGIKVMLEAPMGNATLSEQGLTALPEMLRQGRLLAWLKLLRAVKRKTTFGWHTLLISSLRQWLPNSVYGHLLRLKYRKLTSVSRWSALKDAYRVAATTAAAQESAVPGAASRLLPNEWSRASDDGLTNRLMLLSGDDSGAACKGMLAEWNIDYRDPTADRRLVEFSLRVPAEQLIFGGQPRALLRKVLADRVPRELLDNGLKGYQAADWHEGLNDARDEVAMEVDRIEMFEPSAELMDVEQLRRLVSDWPEPESATWTGLAAIADYRCRLLRAISAASFMREAAGSNY